MNIGFVGCGAFCSGTHVPNAAANPNFNIIAFCDLSQERIDDLDRRYKPRYVTTDMERLFSDPDIEMVVCGTKPDARLPIMELAVKHRKHLFVEKPLCYDPAQIEPMVRLMAHAPVLLMVGFNRPYSPMMQAIKRIYHQHKRGSATIVYRIVGEAQLWPAQHYKAVVEDKESTIVHEATHVFDLLNWLTELEPTRVYTAGEGNMDNVITLTYPQQTTAVVISGDNSTAGFPKERLEINTNHATIIGDHFVEMLAVGTDGGFISRRFPWRMAGRVLETSGYDAIALDWQWRTSVTESEMKKGYYYDQMPRVDKGHAAELEHFRLMIERGAPSVTDVFRGAMANLIAWAAVQSWQQSAPVELDFSHLRHL
jgi:predicted dehydrogenase